MRRHCTFGCRIFQRKLCPYWRTLGYGSRCQWGGQGCSVPLWSLRCPRNTCIHPGPHDKHQYSFCQWWTSHCWHCRDQTQTLFWKKYLKSWGNLPWVRCPLWSAGIPHVLVRHFYSGKKQYHKQYHCLHDKLGPYHRLQIWVSWRWWSELAEGGDMSHLKVVIWVGLR